MEDFLKYHVPEEVEINNYPYKVNVLFLRKKNSSAVVNDDIITIRVSDRLSKENKKEHVLELYNAIVKKIEKSGDIPQKLQEVNDGDIISVSNKQYEVDIKVLPRRNIYSKIRNNKIILRVPRHLDEKERKDLIRKNVKKQIIKDHHFYVTDLIFRLNAEHFQKDINAVKIKELKSRWGSCSTDRNININSKLLNAPKEVLEYVCVHELAHLAELNHSKRFWSLVERAMPNYKEPRKWLSKNGSTLKTF